MSVYTEFGSLKKVIVGNCPIEVDSSLNLNKSQKKLLDRILLETKEDLDFLEKTLKKLNVIVLRPEIVKYPGKMLLSDMAINFPIYPLIPRDQYFVYDKIIFQSYTSLPDRYFDSLSYYKIFNDLFKNGFNWISSPPPLLTNLNSDSWWVNGKEIYNQHCDKLLWHSATFFKCGSDIIVNDKGPGTLLGLEWYKKNIKAKFIVNKNTCCEQFGHIDHGFFMTNENLVIGLKNWIPECLKNKNVILIDDLIEIAPIEEITNSKSEYSSRYDFDWMSKWLTQWRGYSQDVCFDTNVLVVNNNTIIFANHQPHLFKTLEKSGIQCIVCPLRHGGFWESGIHCLTLDVERQDDFSKII